MVRENPDNYEFDLETGVLPEFEEAKDSGTTLDRGTVGELAEVEIGGSDAGSFGAYDRIALGGIPEEHRQNGKSKFEGDLNAADGSSSADGTQVRLLLTDHQRNRRIESTEWFDQDLLEQTDPAKRPTLEFQGVDGSSWAKEGRVAVVQVRNQRQAAEVDYTESFVKFPYVGAY